MICGAKYHGGVTGANLGVQGGVRIGPAWSFLGKKKKKSRRCACDCIPAPAPAGYRDGGGICIIWQVVRIIVVMLKKVSIYCTHVGPMCDM